jgi:hypothetical protein
VAGGLTLQVLHVFGAYTAGKKSPLSAKLPVRPPATRRLPFVAFGSPSNASDWTSDPLRDPYRLKRRFEAMARKPANHTECAEAMFPSVIELEANARGMARVRTPKDEPGAGLRVLCVVYMAEKRYKEASKGRPPKANPAGGSATTRIPLHTRDPWLMHARPSPDTLASTWLPLCDGAVISSDVQNDVSTYIPHRGREAYFNMWQKTRANIKYMYDNYLYEFDWFLSCGDDTYYLISNLKALLASEKVSSRDARGEPLYLGRLYKKPAWPNRDGASLRQGTPAARIGVIRADPCCPYTPSPTPPPTPRPRPEPQPR